MDISKKTQAEKKLKKVFEKLKQIIPKLNNLPTKNLFFAQKVLKMIYLHKNLTKLKFFYLIKLKIGKIQRILGEKSILLSKLKQFS